MTLSNDTERRENRLKSLASASARFYEKNREKIAAARKAKRQHVKTMLALCEEERKNPKAQQVRTKKDLIIIPPPDVMPSEITKEDAFKKLDENPNLNEENRKANHDNLNTFFRIIGTDNILPYMRSYNKTRDVLDAATYVKSGENHLYSSNSKRNYVLSLIHVGRSYGMNEEYGGVEIESFWKLYKQYAGLHLMRDKLLAIEQNRERVYNYYTVMERVKSQFREYSFEYALIRCYWEATLRDDYKDAIYVKSDQKATEKKKNYIVIPYRGKAHIIINKYKTAAKYGSKTREFSPKLSSILKRIVKDIPEGSKIFSKFDLNSITTAVGMPMKVNAIRKSVASTKYFIDKENSVDEVEELSDIMGHTVKVHFESYLALIKDDT